MPNDDAEGVVASLKAYPLGRWYSEPKQGMPGITPERRLAVARLRDTPDAQRQALFELEDRGIGESAIRDFFKNIETIRSTPEGKPLDDDLSNMTSISSSLKGQAKVAAESIQKLAPNDQLNMLAVAATPRETVREARRMVSGMLTDSAVKLELAKLRALGVAQSAQPLNDEEREQLKSIIDGTDSPPNWHVIKERDAWYNRMSVFYGRSVANFDSGGLSSEVNVVGVGFDVSPDLALQVGWAFYEVDEDGSGMTDSDGSFYFGVSLNLFSFRSLANAIVNAGQP
jgi:hypothetical protein